MSRRGSVPTRVLGAAMVSVAVALVWLGTAALENWCAAGALEADGRPPLSALAFARTADEARAVAARWRAPAAAMLTACREASDRDLQSGLARARTAVEARRRLTWAYVVLALLTTTWALLLQQHEAQVPGRPAQEQEREGSHTAAGRMRRVGARVARWLMVPVGTDPLASSVTAGVLLLAWTHANQDTLLLAHIEGWNQATLPRPWSIARLSLLSSVIAAHVALVGGAIRSMLVRRSTADSARPVDGARQDPATPLPTYRALMEAESVGILEEREAMDAVARGQAGSGPGRADVEDAARGALHQPTSIAPTGNAEGYTGSPARGPDTRTVETTPADEPFVAFRAADLTGLALSGGGIRSATFNLGVLQGLHRRDVLGRVDYLSTVSGGGYIGSFWSEWLARNEKRTPGTPDAGSLFPSAGPRRAPRTRVEHDAERHLREFGRFLAPRLGLLEVETWTALVAVVSGLLPALTIALSILGLGLVAWLTLTVPLAWPTSIWPVLVAVAVTGLILWVFERVWQKVKLPLQDLSGTRAAARRRDLIQYIWFALLALVLTAALQAVLPNAKAALRESRLAAREARLAQHAPEPGASATLTVSGSATLRANLDTTPVLSPSRCAPPEPRRGASSVPVRYIHPCWEDLDDGPMAWWRVAGLATPDDRAWTLSPALFDYAIVWFAVSGVLVLVRLLHPLIPSRSGGLWVPPLDRALMRVLGLAVFWSGLAALWHFTLNLDRLFLTAITAAASAGAFALLRNWIGVALRRPKEPGVLDRLKPFLPQILAYATLILGTAAMGQLLIRLCGDDWLSWWRAASVMGGALVLGLFIDPSNFGLHAFYRARISRAYAGACNLAANESAAQNRGTEPKEGDDRPLAELPRRPLHLICCAANDLSGDHIGTLARGARSAVLSRYGLAVGPHAGPVGDLTLGAAVTASAAAFNSNMGDVSMQVGPAVSFLMTALNLRLGLWVRHPKAPAVQPRRWPGLLLFRESFGLTSASWQVPPAPASDKPRQPADDADVADHVPPVQVRDLHLSDGGHFENLALYELVRRQCRYILVSDCGADPTIAFDDLGRALRRIRQDFDIDISIDVDPLKPDALGHSRQHVAVGRIHYSPTDHGILLYVKPTITGDEPADVLQYKTRNDAFPHEGTGDQFYDEAQWESYRRLGLHVAEQVFAFVPPAADPASGALPAATDTGASDPCKPRQPARRVTADWVFGEASYRWGTTPAGLEDKVLEMTNRLPAIDLDLRHAHLRDLYGQVFPELERVSPAEGDAGQPASPVHTGDVQHDIATTSPPDAHRTTTGNELTMLLRVTQFLEDVWLACRLDEWWNHPLNMGWTNLFARWVTSGPFRFWWPVIGPMYSKGFRDFLDERFPLPASRHRSEEDLGVPWEGEVLPLGDPSGSGLAAMWWEERSAQPCPWKPRGDGKKPDAPPIYYENVLTLKRPGSDPVPLQVGLVAVRSAGHVTGWTSDDFFVPPSLWGASIGWYFLDNLLNRFASTYTHAYAVVKDPVSVSGHQMPLDDVRMFVDQYRKIGFRQRILDDKEAPLSPDARALVEALRFCARRDTLLELDLAEWTWRRGRKSRPNRPIAGAVATEASDQ